MKHFSFALIFYLLLSLPSFAQVQINWPEDGLVFQRNKPGTSLTTQVYFVISSTNNVPITAAAVQFQPIALNGSVGSAVDPSSGAVTNAFTGLSGVTGLNTCQVRGYFNVRAGMYRVTARLNNTNNSGTMTIGVGEVFAIAGQSNAAGYAKNGNTSTPYSNTAYVRYNNKKTQRDGDDPGGPGADANTNDFIWYWGRVGEKLVNFFSQSEGRNVPIAFYQAAWSGSGAQDWWATIEEGGVSPRYTTEAHSGYPGRNLREIIGNNLNSYMRKVGIRGILWHQGEYDNLAQKQNYDTYLNELIIRSRNSVSGESNLAWVIARASYVNGSVDTRVPSIVDAQNQVIGNKSGGGVKLFGDPFGSGNGSEKNYRYTGPNTDALDYSYRFHESVVGYTHFNAAGQIAAADKWVESLTQTNGGNNFFNSSIPVINNPATAVANGGTCSPGQQPCACGFTLEGASQVVNQYKVNFIFNSCNAAKLRWYIYAGSNTNGTLVATDTLSPDKGSIDINVPTTMATGTYTIKVTALDCIGADDWTFNYTKPGGVNPPQTCNDIPTKNSGNDSEYADYTVTPASTGSYYLQLTYASGEANPAGRVTVSGATSDFTLLGTGGWTPNTTANITSKTLTGNTAYTIRVAGMNGPPSHTFTHNKLCLVPCSGCRTGIEEASIAVKPEVDESKVFTVFPNPTSGSIKVKYYTENERSVAIKLFDVSGRVLKEFKVQSVKGINESEFDITDLSDAPYILNLNDGVKEHSKQIIKIK